MTQPRTQFDLMRILAPKLAGRDVIVNMATPKTINSFGTTHVNQEGVPTVTIDPYLDDDQNTKTFLHELAHVRLHTDKMIRSDLDLVNPRSVTVSKAEKQPAWELSADALRDEWLRYGRRHADPSLPTGEGVLWALMDYYQKGQ